MRLVRLELENFRGFEKLSLPFHERLTVLVGINGSGKTSVLDALACLGQSNPGPLDVRRGAEACEAEITVDDGSGPATFTAGWNGGKRRERSGVGRLPGELGPPPLPLFLTYRVNRSARDATPGSQEAQGWPARLALEAANNASSQFPVFFGWFREREDLENQERVRGQADYRDPQLQAVRSALASLLPGWSEPRVLRTGSPGNDYGKPVFVVRKGDQELAFDQLSEGERSLAAMVCDIARRLAIANPDAEPLQGNGVVMIDEIDLHLHPRWQAEVLGRLMATFPNLQWVVTTHSPIVLSRVQPESVRILDGFTLQEPGPTYGRDANALLEELFGIQLRPDNVAQLIEDIAQAIDDEKLERARTLLDELAESLGTGDREVTRLRTMIDLLSA